MEGTCKVFTDGACPGNPTGGARGSCAAVLYSQDGVRLAVRSKLLDRTTNNRAEYEGLILGMQLAIHLRVSQLQVCLDSELVQRQMTGIYRVKDATLRAYHLEATALISAFDSVQFTWIPRSENREADRLASDLLR